MNSSQREYLISKVKETYDREWDKLKRQIPEEPSLNNYIIAAFLDNSIKLRNGTVLRDAIREMVIKMGKGVELISFEDDDGNSRRRRRSHDEEEIQVAMCRVKAEDLFIIPKNYTDAWNKYSDKRKEIEKQLEALTAAKGNYRGKD